MSTIAYVSRMLAVLLLLGITNPAPPAAAMSPRSALSSELDAVLSEPALDGVSVAAVVRSADTGEVVYDHDGDQRLPPASGEKLLTSAAALADLGPDYRFRTSVLALEEPRAGAIAGDIYLRGTGDPTLLPDRFDELATQLANRGVRDIKGGIVADDTWFDADRLGFDWSQQDENFAYAAPVSALTVAPDPDFNVGSVQVDVAPGAEVGAPAQVGLTPSTSVVHVENHITTGPAGSPREFSVDRLHGTDRILTAGTMPLDGRPGHPLRSVPDPTAYAADVFRSALTRHGIHVAGETRSASTPDGAVELAGLDSIPLRELLFPLLKLSNNEIAEILVKSMGRHDAHAGSWSAGLQVVRGYVAACGVQPESTQLVDGSGLSTADLIAPLDLTQVLFGVQSEPWFQDWFAALPIAGIPEHLVGGTLADRMVGTPAAGNLHGKTGTLTTTSALEGYVTSASGERLIFSIVESGFVGAPPKEIEDAFAVALAAS